MGGVNIPGPDPSASCNLGRTNRLSNTPDHSVLWHSGLGTHIKLHNIMKCYYTR